MHDEMSVISPDIAIPLIPIPMIKMTSATLKSLTNTKLSRHKDSVPNPSKYQNVYDNNQQLIS
jgi:hypothetical protein